MAKYAYVVILCCALCGWVMAQVTNQVTEIVAYGLYSRPDSDSPYERGEGAEAQMRFWLNPSVGLAFSMGKATWDITEDTRVGVLLGLVGLGRIIEGSVDLYPVGFTLLFKLAEKEKVSLIFDSGIHYVLAESDVTLTRVYADFWGNMVAVEKKVDIDDGVVGRIGAEIAAHLAKNFSAFAGLAYQLDVRKGKLHLDDDTAWESDLRAILVKAGVSVAF